MRFKFNPLTGSISVIDEPISKTFETHFIADISVLEGTVLQMQSPIIDGELLIDGEVYIL